MEDSESAAASDHERPQSGTESGECSDENVKSRDENVAEYGDEGFAKTGDQRSECGDERVKSGGTC